MDPHTKHAKPTDTTQTDSHTTHMPIQQTRHNDKPQTDSRALTGNIDDEHAVLVKLPLYMHDGEEGEGGGQRGMV